MLSLPKQAPFTCLGGLRSSGQVLSADGNLVRSPKLLYDEDHLGECNEVSLEQDPEFVFQQMSLRVFSFRQMRKVLL